MAQKKEQIKAPEKIQLSEGEIANLSGVQFKKLVIRMLIEMGVYGRKIEEKVKTIKSGIKENAQGTNSDRTEMVPEINSLDKKEKINIQPEQNEETRTQKNGERNLQDDFKRSNILIIGVPEEKEEEQEIENLFEKIMKEKFPNLAKEIKFQEVQEAQRVPKKLHSRKQTPRHIIITLPKITDKERILKQQEKRRQLPTKEFP